MAIDIYAAITQAKRLDHYHSTLQDIKSSLNNFQGTLNNGWQATEMAFINRAFDSIQSKINRLSSDLDSLSGDIVTAAYEIKRQQEEEAAKTAAKANAQQQNK